jgi:large subunit ribosomal protein L21
LALGRRFLTIGIRIAITPHSAGLLARLFVLAATAANRKTETPTAKKPVRTCPSTGIEREAKMFAVIKTGGKQYRVAPDEKLKVARLEGEPGTIVSLTEVLMVGGDSPVVGNPVPGASVAAEVVEHSRGPKVIAFKKRRRKNSRRKRGFREEFTLIRITEILTDGKKPSQEAKPKRKRKAKPATKTAEADADATA